MKTDVVAWQIDSAEYRPCIFRSTSTRRAGSEAGNTAILALRDQVMGLEAAESDDLLSLTALRRSVYIGTRRRGDSAVTLDEGLLLQQTLQSSVMVQAAQQDGDTDVDPLIYS